MLVMKISPESGRLITFPQAAVQAYMLFPRDQTSREQYYSIWFAQLAKTATGAMPQLPSFAVEALHDAAMSGDLAQRIEKAIRHGAIAGLVLRIIAQAVRHHPEVASFLAAMAVAERLIARLKETGKTSRNWPSSQATIKNAWTAHKPVAHLWTAAKLADENEGQSGWAAWQTSETGLLRMLALSERLRAIGENHYPHGRSTPTLDPVQTWRLPEGMHLPTVSVEVPPLEPEVLRWIEEDRATR
jgi:hypothetical protein